MPKKQPKDLEHFPELVFGLVGPIGVNMDQIHTELVDALKQVEYHPELIHLSLVLSKFQEPSSYTPIPDSFEAKIESANKFCGLAEDGGAMAAIAISEIREKRAAIEPEQPKRAYIIRQLKREDEISLLRKVYGEKFIQISVSLDLATRIENVNHLLMREQPSLSTAECEQKARSLVATDDNQSATSKEPLKFGQQLGDIFHYGDFFVDGSDITNVGRKLKHFINSLFGANDVSPSKDEFGAFMAASAALRSVDLSRQVGAAILTARGDIVTLGCNEVPKSGGGNYWFDDESRFRDIERGAEQNNTERQRIVVDFLHQLQNSGIIQADVPLSDPETQSKLSSVVDGALISDITEYGRMTHAEMSAICDAARLGRSLDETTLFVTTFPCHNCAKHIIATGISRVVFIEPYPKSRASTSHNDSLSLGTKVDGKVLFEHFEGISPNRYQTIFQKKKRRTGNKINKWYRQTPRPILTSNDNLHVDKETSAINVTLKRILLTQQDPTLEKSS